MKTTPAGFGRWLVFAALSFMTIEVSAIVQPVNITSNDPLPHARWIFGEGESPKGAGPVALLAAVKKAQVDRDYNACIIRSREARGKAKSLGAWLSVAEVDCATKLKPSGANANLLARALETADKNTEWLFFGAQAEQLRGVVLKGYLVLLEQDIKGNRTRAWASVRRLQDLLPYTDGAMRAALWRSAGELSFVQQKPEAAREFFRRSVAEVDLSELRTRIQAIDSAVRGSVQPAPQAAPAPTRAVNAQLESTPEELELVDRITLALKAGELVSAVEDAVKLIREFPGGVRAKWAADRALESYFSLADKTDPKFTSLKVKMVSELAKVDGDRLTEWARVAYNRGQYSDSLEFARHGLKLIDGARATKLLELGAEAAVACDKFGDALELNSTLIKKHAGSASAREALFRSSLIHFRKKDYSRAASSLERLLVLPQAEGLELQARYWLWRSLQKMGAERASENAEILVRRYPFSYYGLRAKLELSGGALELKSMINDSTAKIESRLWLTESERLAWEKLQLLLKSGWLDEAQSELRMLPQAPRAEDKAIRSLLWASAGHYVHASRLANEAWDEKGELRRQPLVRAAFPTEYSAAVRFHAQAKKFDPGLVFGLIKQESGFNSRAVSSSGALGAMQIIPPTAKEIASDLGMGELLLPEDMFDHERNIKMGTHYLAKMLTRYQGSVPLALASYNAGPGRIDRWLRSRSESLKGLPTLRSSAPEDELWFDEIPYDETSFYVKAILRNLLLYRVLDQGRVEVANPVWSLDGITK